jgi:Flp pilus assembly pilin Flp
MLLRVGNRRNASMRRNEKGQGLVVYTLILVLVAVAVSMQISLLGNAIEHVFCGVVHSLTPSYYHVRFDSQEFIMGLNDEFIKIDVKPDDATWIDSVDCWLVDTYPTHGTLEDRGSGIYNYYPSEIDAGTDDSFTYKVYFGTPRTTEGIGTVTIIIGERDNEPLLSVSEAKIETKSKKSKGSDIDDVQEQIVAFYEAALWQEESLGEGIELNLEAVHEGLEVLQDYAGDVQNQLFYSNLTQFEQAVEDGNWDALPDIFATLTSDLAETPLDVYVSMNLKMAPRLIAACEVVSYGTVSQELMDTTLQSVEELDDSYPGKLETLQLLQDLGEVVATRNTIIQGHTSFQLASLEKIVALLELAGEDELADQLAIQSESCGY